MLRAKDALTTLPTCSDDDFNYASEGDDNEFVIGSEVGDKDPYTPGSLSSCIYSSHFQVGGISKEFVMQYKRVMVEPPTEDLTRKFMLSLYQDNLKMHKVQFLHQHHELKDIRGRNSKMYSRHITV